MTRRLGLLFSLAALALPAHAGDIAFEMFGTVASGSAPSGPFSTISGGQPVHIRFEIFTPGSDVVPGQYTSYTVDVPSILVEIGAASDVGATPANVCNVANDFTISDGVQLTFQKLAGGNRFDFEFTDCNGTTFTSTDVLVNQGSWSASSFCSYNFAIHSAGAFIDILPTTVTLGVPAPGTPFCFGDGALVDHTSACPCGNNGTIGRGCGHSFDAGGAQLAATGDIPSDDVVLASSFEPATSFTLFLQHASTGDTVFHDGVLCAGGTLIRLRGRAAVAGQASFPNSAFAQDQTTTLSQRGGVAPGLGVTRYYSAWFRNASTTFCPPATANITNGWRIDW